MRLLVIFLLSLLLTACSFVTSVNDGYEFAGGTRKAIHTVTAVPKIVTETQNRKFYTAWLLAPVDIPISFVGDVVYTPFYGLGVALNSWEKANRNNGWKSK